MVTQKVGDADNSQQLWQAVVTGKNVAKIPMYRYERNPDGTLSDEIIEMHLPAAGSEILKYMKRGFVMKKSDLGKAGGGVEGPSIKVYACDVPGCDKEFPAKGALGLHKKWHRDQEAKGEQTNKT